MINADDFGLTVGVNRAIVELNHAGVLTSATLMARAQATEEAVEQTRSTSCLRVGCHVVLVDGSPVLSPTEDIPHLADPTEGCFRSSLVDFLYWLYLGNGPRRSSLALRTAEIEAEATAQIALLQSKGINLTHIDTHKHTHMFPAVLRPILRAAASRGIRVVRNPFEPFWSLKATNRASWVRRTEVNLLRHLEPAFRRTVAQEGFTTTDGAIGVLATGALDAATITELLRQMPSGTWELVTHPGYNDAALAQIRTRLLASRETERVGLMALRQFPDIKLISFADL